MMPAVSPSDALLEQSPACHWLIDSHGVFERIYGDCLPLLGKIPAELAGRSIASVLPPELAALWTGRIGKVFNNGKSIELRERCGKSTWDISVFPVHLDGRVGYAGVLAREVTAWGNAEQQLRYTVLSALEAQGSERKSVARFLHDSIGQNLTALGMQLDLVRMDMESNLPDAGSRLIEIQGILGQMMEEVREYVNELNPSTVERVGLPPALERLGARIRARFTGTLRLEINPDMQLEPKIASAIFRITQEAVENALQHSGCSTIEIEVQSTRTGTLLEVRDDGQGFDSGELIGRFRGLGLLGMEHYASQAGLELSILSRPGAGTTIRAKAPAAV
jgi:signal transduction histidine kinase